MLKCYNILVFLLDTVFAPLLFIIAIVVMVFKRIVLVHQTEQDNTYFLLKEILSVPQSLQSILSFFKFYCVNKHKHK